ncbi:unnamed protein product [Danaus chrysippus]|uniref:(African queen) hypothetical protein n=1 Tax=Danaus chrysippus TaxID=151541 RepID=A0A8J2R5P1_9NEOP|nr:unnamed protein product [Danaus chrysippus]
MILSNVIRVARQPLDVLEHFQRALRPLLLQCLLNLCAPITKTGFPNFEVVNITSESLNYDVIVGDEGCFTASRLPGTHPQSLGTPATTMSIKSVLTHCYNRFTVP